MTTVSGGTGEGRSRWFNILLIASLALNLLFVGGLAKAAWHHRHGGFDGFGLMGFARNLPPDRQQFLRDEIKAARDAVKPLRQEMRDRWSDANKVLVEEPFDKEKYKAAMDRVTEADNKIKAVITNALADTASKLNPAEREALKAWRDKRKSHMFGKRHRKDDDGGGE